MNGDASAGPGPSGASRRLFFALWPDDAQRAALVHALRKAVRSCGGRPVPAANLHVTLVFLGSVAAPRVDELDRVARHIALNWAGHAPLVLRLARLAHWARPQILCALGEAAPQPPDDPASALAALLRDETVARGFSPDLKPFHAHVTVARKVARAIEPGAALAIEWRFDRFALVESRTLPAGPVYSVVASYLLAKAEKAHE